MYYAIIIGLANVIYSEPRAFMDISKDFTTEKEEARRQDTEKMRTLLFTISVFASLLVSSLSVVTSFPYLALVVLPSSSVQFVGFDYSALGYRSN